MPEKLTSDRFLVEAVPARRDARWEMTSLWRREGRDGVLNRGEGRGTSSLGEGSAEGVLELGANLRRGR